MLDGDYINLCPHSPHTHFKPSPNSKESLWNCKNYGFNKASSRVLLISLSLIHLHFGIRVDRNISNCDTENFFYAGVLYLYFFFPRSLFLLCIVPRYLPPLVSYSLLSRIDTSFSATVNDRRIQEKAHKLHGSDLDRINSMRGPWVLFTINTINRIFHYERSISPD